MEKRIFDALVGTKEITIMIMNKSIYGDLSWLDDYENVWKVGMWLADDKYGWTWAKKNLAYYFEKPYKYTEEFEEWREYMDWEMENASEYDNGYDCWLRRFK